MEAFEHISAEVYSNKIVYSSSDKAIIYRFSLKAVITF